MKNDLITSEPVTIQLATTTADEEKSYFAGAFGPLEPGGEVPESVLPAGNYRIVGGHLYRLSSGIPPHLEDAGEED